MLELERPGGVDAGIRVERTTQRETQGETSDGADGASPTDGSDEAKSGNNDESNGDH